MIPDAIPELSDVRLRYAVESSEGLLLPAGTTGTVVHVSFNQNNPYLHHAYLVEFTEPFQCIEELMDFQLDELEDDELLNLTNSKLKPMIATDR